MNYWLPVLSAQAISGIKDWWKGARMHLISHNGFGPNTKLVYNLSPKITIHHKISEEIQVKMIIAFLPISFCTFVLPSGAKQRNIYNQLQLWFPFPDTKKSFFFVMSVNFFWQLFFLAFHHKTIIEYLVVTLPGAWLDPDSVWMTASQKGSCPGQGISKRFSIPLCCVCLVHTCVCLSETSLDTSNATIGIMWK